MYKKPLLTYIICILHFLPLNLTITYLLYQRSIQTSLSNFAYVVNSNVEFITCDIVMRIAKEKEKYINLSSINILFSLSLSLEKFKLLTLIDVGMAAATGLIVLLKYQHLFSGLGENGSGG